MAGRAQFDALLNARLSQMTVEEVVEALERHKVPCGRVNDLHSLFTSQTASELGLVEQVGTQRFVRSPIRTDRDNMAPLTPPPALNQDGRDIMRELGLSEEQMQEVERESAVAK